MFLREAPNGDVDAHMPLKLCWRMEKTSTPAAMIRSSTALGAASDRQNQTPRGSLEAGLTHFPCVQCRVRSPRATDLGSNPSEAVDSH